VGQGVLQKGWDEVLIQGAWGPAPRPRGGDVRGCEACIESLRADIRWLGGRGLEPPWGMAPRSGGGRSCGQAGATKLSMAFFACQDIEKKSQRH